MDNRERSSPRGDLAADRDVHGTRRTVEWYFGDLVANVAASAPVSECQLFMSLTRVEEDIREQYTELTNEVQDIATAGAPSEVLGLSSATWESLIGDSVSPTTKQRPSETSTRGWPTPLPTRPTTGRRWSEPPVPTTWSDRVGTGASARAGHRAPGVVTGYSRLASSHCRYPTVRA